MAQLRDPFPLDVPAGTWQVGNGPFWRPGDRVLWHFRRHDFPAHRTEVVQPARVVRDDERGSVLWIAGDTPTAESRIVGFEDINPHDVPFEKRFLPPGLEPARVQVPGVWRGRGVLRIVPAGMPFSVWVFTGADERFAAWYINLEQLHRRDAGHLYTADHVLDIVIRGDGAPNFKDEDELAGTVNGGMWTEQTVETIRGHAEAALQQFRAGHWAFGAEWQNWRPPESWAMTAAQVQIARQQLQPWLGG